MGSDVQETICDKDAPYGIVSELNMAIRLLSRHNGIPITHAVMEKVKQHSSGERKLHLVSRMQNPRILPQSSSRSPPLPLCKEPRLVFGRVYTSTSRYRRD